MKSKPYKFITLTDLVKDNYFPYRSKEAFYKALVRSRLLKPENGFYNWKSGANGRSRWVLDVRYIKKLQEIFLNKKA